MPKWIMALEMEEPSMFCPKNCFFQKNCLIQNVFFANAGTPNILGPFLVKIDFVSNNCSFFYNSPLCYPTITVHYATLPDYLTVIQLSPIIISSSITTITIDFSSKEMSGRKKCCVHKNVEFIKFWFPKDFAPALVHVCMSFSCWEQNKPYLIRWNNSFVCHWQKWRGIWSWQSNCNFYNIMIIFQHKLSSHSTYSLIIITSSAAADYLGDPASKSCSGTFFIAWLWLLINFVPRMSYCYQSGKLKTDGNTSLAAMGVLAHRLQRRTACKIRNGRQGAPKWLIGSGKGFTSRFLGAPVNFL